MAERIFRRLYQVLSGRDHPPGFTSPNAFELRRTLALIDDRVPPRHAMERRHRLHQEWYCLKRYLPWLADAGLLEFPLQLWKCESPDFMLTDGTGARLGVEVSEATLPDFQAELTRTSRSDGVHDLDRGGLLQGEAEQGLLTLVEERMRAKHTLRQQSHWGAVEHQDLLLYNNGPFIFVREEFLRRLLTESRLSEWREAFPGFRYVSILSDGRLIFDLLGKQDVLP